MRKLGRCTCSTAKKHLSARRRTRPISAFQTQHVGMHALLAPRRRRTQKCCCAGWPAAPQRRRQTVTGKCSRGTAWKSILSDRGHGSFPRRLGEDGAPRGGGVHAVEKYSGRCFSPGERGPTLRVRARWQFLSAGGGVQSKKSAIWAALAEANVFYVPFFRVCLQRVTVQLSIDGFRFAR